jgi:hypothetical protein
LLGIDRDVGDDVERIELVEDDLVHTQLVDTCEVGIDVDQRVYEDSLRPTDRGVRAHNVPGQIGVGVGALVSFAFISVVIRVTNKSLLH